MAAPSVVHTGLDFGEGPRWRAGRLWYSDFYRHAVFSIRPDGGDARVEVDLDDEQPSGLGWLPDGTLLVVAMQARQVLAVDGGASVKPAYVDDDGLPVFVRDAELRRRLGVR